MSENLAFTDRLIRRLQGRPCAPGASEAMFRQAGTDYLITASRMGFDLERGLWLVNSPQDGWQVAIWMPVMD